ncbi:MAG: Spy/CpxP family protein refolding chaperone [Fuerstiella sp.]
MKSSRFLKLSFAACALAILVTASADAQPPAGGGRGQRGGQPGQGGNRQRGGFGGFGGGGPGGGGPGIDRATLLGVEQVKDELNIDDGQSSVIAAALEAYQAERRESAPDFSKVREMSEEDRTEFFAKMQKDREALSSKTDTVLNTLLMPEQVTRLDQIVFQIKARTGLIAMIKTDEMKKTLSITDEQLVKLDAAEKEAQEASAKMREEMRGAFQPGQGGERPDFTEMQKKMETARKEGEAKVMAVLTDAQQAKIAELKGEEFNLDMRSLMRGGGGGRGGFGGPGGPGGQRPGGDGGQGGNRRRPSTDEAI